MSRTSSEGTREGGVMSNVPSSVRCEMCVHYEDGVCGDEIPVAGGARVEIEYDGKCFFRVPPVIDRGDGE